MRISPYAESTWRRAALNVLSTVAATAPSTPWPNPPAHRAPLSPPTVAPLEEWQGSKRITRPDRTSTFRTEPQQLETRMPLITEDNERVVCGVKLDSRAYIGDDGTLQHEQINRQASRWPVSRCRQGGSDLAPLLDQAKLLAFFIKAKPHGHGRFKPGASGGR